MKSIFLLTSFCFAFGLINAQKIVEKRFPFSSKEAVSLNLQIADSIRIVTWNKNEVYVKGSININNNKFNDDYKVSFDESGRTIEVKAKFETDRKSNWNSDSNCCNYNTDIYWDVYIPENATFSVETINGNIVIEGKTEEIKAYTISGFIDLAVPAERKADFKLSTVTGTVYSNILADNPSNKHSSHSDINNKYNGGGKPVNLRTVSGDIYLRKAN